MILNGFLSSNIPPHNKDKIKIIKINSTLGHFNYIFMQNMLTREFMKHNMIHTRIIWKIKIKKKEYAENKKLICFH